MKKLILVSVMTCSLLFSGCKDRGSNDTPSAGNRLAGGNTQSVKTDVVFAREAFQLLAKGDVAAERMIDWETLKVSSMDVGAQYRDTPVEEEKASFRKSFISSYSSSFQSSGASVDALSNWRVQSKDPSKTIVAADTPAKDTILLTVLFKDGQQKLSAIDIREAK